MKISPDQLARQLESELGADAVTVEPGTLARHVADGKQPTLVCTAATPEQIATLMKLCADAQAAVIPWGGGTAMAIGNPPRRADVVISTTRMNRLIEHDHANLTVTVQSGISLDALQASVAAQKQFVPFDPPFPERSTIGGIVAANLNGPRRSSYGSVRDLVIGMKVVLASGEIIKAGGKVVKNVAGYDMCKLFTGSLGSLGILTEATVRVAPIPEERATGIARGTLAQAVQLASELADSKLLPSGVVLANGDNDQKWRLVVGFEGFDESVGRQIGELDSLAKRNGMVSEIHREANDQRVWREIDDLPLQADRLIYRVNVPRSAVSPVLGTVQRSLVGAAEPALQADVAMGTIWIVLAANKTGAGHFTELISLAQQHHGHAVMFAAPPELKLGIEVWGPSPPTISLMREIKQQFDPQSLLNPGRFVGGL